MPQPAQATSLQLRRRFVFRGNAAAFGGRFVRPDDVFLEMPGASSLSVVGGRSVASFRGPAEEVQGLSELRLRHDVRRRQVRRSQEGDRADPRQGARRDAGHLDARPRRDQSADRRTPRNGSRSAGWWPSFARPVLRRRRQRTDHSSRRGRHRRPGHRRLRAAGHLRFQRVRRTRYARQAGCGWSRRPRSRSSTARSSSPIARDRSRSASRSTRRSPPGSSGRARRIRRAEIVANNLVVVKDFGKIFFGEILINAGSRRLTLMRLELGSDGGGQAGGPDVDINGGFSP